MSWWVCFPCSVLRARSALSPGTFLQIVFPVDVLGKELPLTAGQGSEAAGGFGVSSLAVFLIANSEDGYCPFSSVSAPSCAALVSLSACIPAIK